MKLFDVIADTEYDVLVQFDEVKYQIESEAISNELVIKTRLKNPTQILMH